MEHLEKILSHTQLSQAVGLELDETFIQDQDTAIYLLDEKVESFIEPRKRQSHKGTYGHALILAGSYGKIGAAVLSAKACLRSGAGLLTTYVPKCGYNIVQISVPESMCLTDKNEQVLTTLPELNRYNSIGVGPGIGMDEQTSKMLSSLLQTNTQPLILDADAINLLSADKALIDLLPKNTVLTPHIKEFDRLVGTSTNTIQRLEKQRAFSQKYQCIIVLKNAYTSVSDTDGNLYFNSTGNQGMATAGSGDTLTGIITGLLAQGYLPLIAALIGVYFHGKAGDDAVKQKSYSSLIATDIIEKLNIKNKKHIF